MMNRILQKILGKKNLLYNKQGIEAKNSNGDNVIVKWDNVSKIVILKTFEEYSGYFLTDDYLTKKLYHDIMIDCTQNVVKVRTGGAPSVKRNTSEPFSKNFGTTSIHYPIFVEYLDASGNKCLYANHYNEDKKEELIKKLATHLSEKKIIQKKKVEGFTPLSEL